MDCTHSTTHGQFQLWTLAETVQLMENFTYGHLQRQYNSWKISLMFTAQILQLTDNLIHVHCIDSTTHINLTYVNCTDITTLEISLMYSVQTLQL